MTKPAATSAKIAAFVAESMAVADRRVLLNLGAVENHEAIKDATGFNLAGFERVIDNYSVRHSMKQHGSHAKEEARGQIAVALSDFSLIPLITSAPDAIFHDGRNKIGREVLVFTKVIDGVGYRHVEEIRSKNRLVATDSLRKKKGPWGP